ncbi:MAG: hypothetical protein ACOZQL_22840 [Myxococcota bacterium]
MEAVVIAVPPDAPPARVGERFKLREGSLLRVGPGREARLRLGPLGAGDLLIGTRDNRPFVRATTPPLRASLSGRELYTSRELQVHSGDSLYVHPGLVLEFRETAPARATRHQELEAQLGAHDDDATWAVYRDFLDEVGDPLGGWLRHAPLADEEDRLRQLRGLADAVRGGLVQVTWSPRGMLTSLTLTRQAVTGAPGLEWYLAQLAKLPVARLLPRVSVALFAGGLPGRFDESPDAQAARVLDTIATFDGVAALRSLSLGFVSQPREWPRAHAAWQRLRASALRLGDWSGVLVSGRHALLSLVERPPDVEVVSPDVVLNPARTDVGTSANCLVRLIGPAPQVSCTLYRSTEGQWVVFDESADPFRPAHGRFALRLNGAVVNRAVLAPGDVLEPVEGLKLRFSFS